MSQFKSLTFALLFVFGLSGCYTQLQYSQKMNKVSDRDQYEREYSAEERQRSSSTDENRAYEDENYVPVYYKDYETANYWNECGCDPYAYEEGYQDGYSDAQYYNRGPRYYGSYNSSFRFGHGYSGYRPHFGNRFVFSVGFGHRPFYSSFYYDPFYSSFAYNPFWYGFRPYYGSSFYFYGNNGFGFSNVGAREPDRRYGLRSRNGSSRVGTKRTRTRGGTSRIATPRTRSSNDRVRSRSGSSKVERGRSRSRGTGRVGSSGSRSRGSSGSVGRSRSEGSRDSKQSRSRSRKESVDRDRSGDKSISRIGLRHTQRQQMRQRALRSYQANRERMDRRSRNIRTPNRQKSSNGFWDRVKRTISNSNSFRNVRNSGSRSRSVRSRSGSSRSDSKVRSGRSRSRSSSGSSVKRSRSKSSSSGSRSRSSGSSRSRDRGNN